MSYQASNQQAAAQVAAPPVVSTPVNEMPEPLPIPEPEPKSTVPVDPVIRVGRSGQPPVVYGAQPAEALPVHDVAPDVPPPVLPDAPVMVDVPYASQAGEVLSCTMGNWDNMQDEPHSYAYQWAADSVLLLTGTEASYSIAFEDIGRTFNCTVTATNAGGSTSVVSNDVVVVSPVI